MKRFQNILCCVNDPGQPDPALHRAVALAKSNGASLTLADADHSGIHFWQTDAMQRDIERQRMELLDELARDLREPGLAISTTVLSGHPAAAIIAEVASVRHDLVMKTSRAEGLATRLFFGETAIRLMRRCPCPVWILQPQHSEFGRILAAVDAGATDDAHQRLNRQIIEMAASLADSEQCELHIAYVTPDFEDSPLIRGGGFASKLSGLRQRAIADAESGLTALLESTGADVPPRHIHPLTGVPGEALSKFAKRQHIDLILMGTIMRSGFDGFTIGNTAEKVLYSVDCSILTVRPTSFHSAAAG